MQEYEEFLMSCVPKCRPKVFHCMRSTDMPRPRLICLFLEQGSKLERTHRSVWRQTMHLSKALLKRTAKHRDKTLAAKNQLQERRGKRKLLHCLQSLHTYAHKSQQQHRMAQEYNSSDCHYSSYGPPIKKKVSLGFRQNPGGSSQQIISALLHILALHAAPSPL